MFDRIFLKFCHVKLIIKARNYKQIESIRSKFNNILSATTFSVRWKLFRFGIQVTGHSKSVFRMVFEFLNRSSSICSRDWIRIGTFSRNWTCPKWGIHRTLFEFNCLEYYDSRKRSENHCYFTSGGRGSGLIEHIKGIFSIEGQDKNYEQNNIIRISLRNSFKWWKFCILIR